MFYVRRLVSPNSLASNKHIFNLAKSLSSSEAKQITQTNQNPAHFEGLNLSEPCIKRLKEIYQADKQYLKISVEAGGCSGLNYIFTLEPKISDQDLVVEKQGSKLLVDKETLEFIKGATVDYYEELIRTGFRIIDNPNSEQGCSCGSSFTIKI